MEVNHTTLGGATESARRAGGREKWSGLKPAGAPVSRLVRCAWRARGPCRLLRASAAGIRVHQIK